MLTSSKTHRICKTAAYRWAYGSNCLHYLQNNGISKRRFKKWFFKRLLQFSYQTKDASFTLYTKEYIIKTWYYNIKHLG